MQKKTTKARKTQTKMVSPPCGGGPGAAWQEQATTDPGSTGNVSWNTAGIPSGSFRVGLGFGVVRRIRTSDIASLAQIERELYEVEEQLVSKKIAERLPVSLAAKSATLAALERVEKARKELDEASRELLTALNLQGSSTDSL